MGQEPEADFIRDDKEKQCLIKEAGTSKDNKDADVVVVLDHTWGTVEECGLGNIFNNRIVKVLTKKGIAQMSVLRFDYDPDSYVNDVRRLRVHRSKGGVEEVDVKEFADINQPERLLYWRTRMKLCTIPHLQVGDAIEWEIFRKGFQIAYLNQGAEQNGAATPESTSGTGSKIAPGRKNAPERTIAPGRMNAPEFRRDYVDPVSGLKPPMYSAFYDIVFFEEKIPIKEKRYTLVTPCTMPLYYEVYQGVVRSSLVRHGDEYLVYSWEKKDVDAYKPESRMWGEVTALTKLLVSTIPHWQAKSRWFWDRNRYQFEWDNDIKAMTDQVCAGCKNDDEKALALLHWVSQNIRYIGFSLGEGEGYTLHPGTMTFHERGGVCKDLAGMLITMMRAAGLEAYPAQTEALEPINRITADQFGHCVVARKMPGGSWEMYDPTWAIFGMNIWDAAETQQHYLIGTQEGEDLACTPLHKPEDSLLSIKANTALDSEGLLSGCVEWQGRGRSDSTRRVGESRTPSRRRKTIFQSFMTSIDPEIELKKINHSDLHDLYKPYEQRVEFTVDSYALADESRTGCARGMFFRLPMARFMTHPRLNIYINEDKLEERKFDVRVIFLYKIEVDETIQLPRGYKLASTPFDIDMDTPPASFKARLTARGNRLRFKADFALKVRTITPKQYKDFKKVLKAVKDLASRMVRIQTTASRGATSSRGRRRKA